MRAAAPAPSARRTRARRAHTARAPAPRAAENEIGDEGAKELAAALKANKTLTKLTLGANHINDRAALAAIRSILDANKASPPASEGPEGQGAAREQIVQKNVRGNSARKEVSELKKENQWCKCFACFK